MVRELLLMRHGKADKAWAGTDPERPLKDRGKRDAQRLGVWLWQQDLRPDHVLSSPAERALVSAEKCCKAMDLGAAGIRRVACLHPGTLEAMLRVLADCPADARRVLLVGHNPACEDLLRHLVAHCPGQPEGGVLMKTGTLVRIALPDDWRALAAGSGALQRIVSGRMLPRKFPYPAPNGAEQRDRPAYYYEQSAVIPFRMRDGAMEVLVVGSSKRSRWVVPKGVSGPGHSLQESARIEAYEEAGVEGEVLDEELGMFVVEKWGATCNVKVFPMRVTRVLSDTEWEEQHRGREWLPCEAAAARVAPPELGRLIAEFGARKVS